MLMAPDEAGRGKVSPEEVGGWVGGWWPGLGKPERMLCCHAQAAQPGALKRLKGGLTGMNLSFRNTSLLKSLLDKYR